MPAMATRRLYASVLPVFVASAISVVAQGSQAPAEETIAKLTVKVFEVTREPEVVDLTRDPGEPKVGLTKDGVVFQYYGDLTRDPGKPKVGLTKTDFVVVYDGKSLEILAFREGTAQAGDPLSPGQYELSVKRSDPSDEWRVRIGVRASGLVVRHHLSRP